MRFAPVVVVVLLNTFRVVAETLPTSVEVTIEPQKFGDAASILKVDSTVASFKFDQPVKHLALVLESRPKEPRTVPVARLSIELTKPVKDGRFCVQMVDQGFLPIGNGAPHQMQLFMQLDCGGALTSSSQSFLKEKFNAGRSRARTGAGTLTRRVTGNRAPVFWMMGNSDSGTYFNDDDLEKMVAKNKDAYVLIAYLEVAKEAPAPSPTPSTPELAQNTPATATPPPDAKPTEEVKPAVVTPKPAASTQGKSASKKPASTTKKKKKVS